MRDGFFFIISVGGILVKSFSGVLAGPGTPPLSTELVNAEWNENSSVSRSTLSISFNRLGLAVTRAGPGRLGDFDTAAEAQSKSTLSFCGETLGMGWFRSENVTCVEHSNSPDLPGLGGVFITSDFFPPPLLPIGTIPTLL